MTESYTYWVALNLVKGIGAARMRILLDSFGSAEAAWTAPAEELRAAGLGPKLVETFQKVRSGGFLEDTLERIRRGGIRVLTWEDEEYPRRLMEIDQPPPVLYLLGAFAPQDDLAAAIVGTRGMTAYGRQVTEELAAALAHHGVTVVSGLARGVDGSAHAMALKSGGRTLAVLGSGVDIIYPPEHRRLAEETATRGAVISDYAPGTPPDAPNFPPRNRIISGLARAVVVVEAGESSGALITAAFAADQGRQVFAVPGTIYAPHSRGTNRLIQRGAQPLLSPKDLLEALDLEQVSQQISARQVLPADAVEAQLYSLLNKEPLHVDEIRARTSLPIEKVSATLTLMELKGLVRQVGGMNYVAVKDEMGAYDV